MKEPKRPVGRPKAAKGWATKMEYRILVNFGTDPQVHSLLFSHQHKNHGVISDLIEQALLEYIQNHNLPFQSAEQCREVSVAAVSGQPLPADTLIPQSTEMSATPVEPAFATPSVTPVVNLPAETQPAPVFSTMTPEPAQQALNPLDALNHLPPEQREMMLALLQQQGVVPPVTAESQANLTVNKSIAESLGDL